MPRRPHASDLLRRLLAAGAAALVLALTVFAASPDLHRKLHAHADHDDGCAVVLFASGVPLPVSAVVAVPPPASFEVPRATVAEEIFVCSPRYLRLPERGPPALS
jgi:hypothetical protein